MSGETAGGMISSDVSEAGRRRDVSLDVVRILGLFAVLVGHVWYVPSVMLFTYSWHVPVFFVLAGYLWRDERTPAEDLRRRVRSIVEPYVTWWLTCTAIFVGLGWTLYRAIPFKFVFLAAWGGAGALRPYTAFSYSLRSSPVCCSFESCRSADGGWHASEPLRRLRSASCSSCGPSALRWPSLGVWPARRSCWSASA